MIIYGTISDELKKNDLCIVREKAIGGIAYERRIY